MSLHHDLRIDWRFIRRVDAGELADLPCPRLFVKIFRIPFFTDCERRFDKDLDEFGITFHRNRASPLPIGPVRRNEGSDDDVAGVSHQLRYFAHPPNIFDAVIRREPEIGIQTMSDVVAIQNVGMHCSNEKFALERLRDGGFSRSGKASQPDDSATMSVLGGARLRVDFPFAPENVLALHRSAIGVNAAVNNSAAANHAIIDQNKTAQWRNATMVIQNDWRARLNGQAADLVARPLLDLGRA